MNAEIRNGTLHERVQTNIYSNTKRQWYILEKRTLFSWNLILIERLEYFHVLSKTWRINIKPRLLGNRKDFYSFLLLINKPGGKITQPISTRLLLEWINETVFKALNKGLLLTCISVLRWNTNHLSSVVLHTNTLTPERCFQHLFLLE